MSLPGWTNPAIAQLEGGALRPGFLFRMSTVGSSPPTIVRLWAGLGEIAISPDSVETGATEAERTYRGIGELVGLPPFSQLINGVAERVEFTLSGAGISSDLAALASTEASEVRGATINIGFLVFDAQWDVISPTLWAWEGRADSLKVDRSGEEAGPVRSLTISAGSLLTGRRRPITSYFTDPDQKRRSSDDDFFDRVKLYSQGSTKVWPS